MELSFRPATDSEADAAYFAWGLDEAMDGFLRVLLGARHLEITAAASRIPGQEFSLEHVTFAERDGQIVGMLNGMPAEAMADGTLAIARYAGVRIVRSALIVLAAWPLFLSMSRHAAGEWYLQSIAVSPGFRGQGAGSELLSLAEDKARASGCHRIALDVVTTHAGGIRFYERWGAKRERTSFPAWLIGGVRVHRMSKTV